MIIKLNESVKMNEFAEILLYGVNDKSNQYKVEFTFSKEGLIGFATNLLWLYEEINPKRCLHLHIDPLLGNISGNQSLGFFLTPKSPSMVINVNGNNKYTLDDKFKCKDVLIKHKFVKEVEIKEPAVDESIEEYELGLNNIVSIRILDCNNLDITADGMQIVFNIGFMGLKDFSTMLLILANNYGHNQKYIAANVNQNEKQYNMGVLFSENSCEVILKCNYLGSVYSYDPHFGLVD